MSRLVIGVGNPFRGDDAVGLVVAEQVRTADVRLCRTGSVALIDAWSDHDDVVIVDAMRSGAPAGSVLRFDVAAGPLPGRSFTSTHSVGLAETIELARELGRLPGRLEVCGIEVGDTTEGAPLTPAVAKAADAVVAVIDHA